MTVVSKYGDRVTLIQKKEKIVPSQSDSVKCNSIKNGHYPGSCPNKCPRRKYHSPFLIITERDFILLNNGFCKWVGKEIKCVPKTVANTAAAGH